VTQGTDQPGTGARGSLEEGIAAWRSYLRRRQAIHPVDMDELEDHLRSQARALEDAGLMEDEAFLIAVKRIGELDALSREFAREHSERLWKRLVLAPDAGQGDRGSGREAVVAVGLAVASAVAVKAPELFGARLQGDHNAPSVFYLRNFSLLVFPFLACFFVWKRSLATAGRLWLGAAFVGAGVVINTMPFAAGGHTESLAALHLPMALWFAVGYAYVAGRWRDHEQRMNYVRFSGEWCIYYALIALGGGVLTGLTLFIFRSLGLDAGWLIDSWVLPCGVVGAMVIAAWLAEAKQSVIENMAPVLTLLFTPLFTLVLLAFLGATVWTGSGVAAERNVLIGFDLLLVVVVGLILYAISARDPLRSPGLFDVLQLLLVVCALFVDAVALKAIAARISEFGFSPNKVAALGENIILLVNLGWSAGLYGRFLAGRVPFTRLERWQTAYILVYALWACVIVVIFPALFGFR
jgi:hypothetical protein